MFFEMKDERFDRHEGSVFGLVRRYREKELRGRNDVQPVGESVLTVLVGGV